MQCLTPIRTCPGLNSTPQDSQQRGGISSYPRRVRRSLATPAIVGIGSDGTFEVDRQASWQLGLDTAQQSVDD